MRILHKEKKDIFYKLVYWLFWICFFVMMTCIFLARNAQDFPFLRIEVLVMLGGIFYILTRKSIPQFPLFLFITSLLVRFIVIFLIKTEPVSDFKLLFDSAQMLAAGDYSFNDYVYYQMWPYQIGFLMWEAFFLKIWNSVWVLKIVNCFLSAGINLLIYLLAKELLKEENCARFVSVVYMILPFSMLHVTVLTNSHASGFFLFLGVYIITCSKKFRLSATRWIIAAICIAIGNLLRPDGLILLVSIGVWTIFLVLKADKAKQIKKILLRMVLFFVTYFLLINAITGLVRITGIGPNGLGNENPLWKFVVGTNYESNGSYSKKDDDYVQGLRKNTNYTYEEIEIPMIKERVVQKKKMLCLIDKKIGVFWWGNALGWSFSDEEIKQYPEIIENMVGINKSIWCTILCLMGIGIVKWYTLAKERDEALLIPFIVIASFSVYLLIEVQPRYLYLVQIAAFVMAAGGVDYLWEKFKERLHGE